MEKLAEQAIKNTTKISLNIDENLLKIIDNLVKLTKSNRTIIIAAIAYKGIPDLLQNTKKSWQTLLIKGNLGEAKKIKIKGLLKELEKIELKWYKNKEN